MSSSPQTQPLSGIPTPVAGVTGGQGLPQGVASVDGGTGNVVIAPPSNVVQQRKGDIPQSFQNYEYFHSNTDFVRIALQTATGGPEFIGVQAAPLTVLRDLIIGTTGNLRLNSGNSDRWIINGVSGALAPFSDNVNDLGDVTHFVRDIYANSLGLRRSGSLNGNFLFSGQSTPPPSATGSNGDFWFNGLGSAALTAIYQKRAGVWVGIA
jgi:hypothetical protein